MYFKWVHHPNSEHITTTPTTTTTTTATTTTPPGMFNALALVALCHTNHVRAQQRFDIIQRDCAGTLGKQMY